MGLTWASARVSRGALIAAQYGGQGLRPAGRDGRLYACPVQGNDGHTRGGQRRTKGLLALSAAALSIGAFGVSGGAAAGGESSPEAERALEGAVEAVGTPAQPAGGDATIALHQLQLSYPDLRAPTSAAPGPCCSARRRARPALPRISSDRTGTPPRRADSPVCTKHFCVHWVDTERRRAPDGRQQRTRRRWCSRLRREDPAHRRAVLLQGEQEAGLAEGRRATATAAATRKIDVYLSQIGNVGLFGYANTDQGQSGGNRRFSYLVLDNDYKEFAPLTPLQPLQVTVAHEYNHILQFGIDYNEQLWMFEASATWMEEQVYPAVSDWLRYVPGLRGLDRRADHQGPRRPTD